MAVLHPFGDPAFVEKTWQDTAARELGLALFRVDIKSVDDLEPAFARIKEGAGEALIAARSTLTFILGKQTADLALAARQSSRSNRSARSLTNFLNDSLSARCKRNYSVTERHDFEGSPACSARAAK